MAESNNCNSRLIWADKAILAFAFFAALLWAAFWFSAFMVIGDLGSYYLWVHLGIIGTKVGILVLMSAWLILRTIDFAFGGSTYRLAAQTALILERAIVRGGRGVARLASRHEAQIAG